jgi:HSP20 family protein
MAIAFGGHVMAETPTKVPMKTGQTTGTATPYGWRPFESLPREIDRLFDDFGGGFWRSPFPRSFFDMAPFGRGEPGWAATPSR